VIVLLQRNGMIPPPPPELEGESFKVEYVGALSLALQSGEVEASQQWIGLISEIDAIEPTAKDNINFDSSVRRMGRTFGVNEEDIATIEERDEKRAIRAQQLQDQKIMEAATAAGQANQGLAVAPQEGSPAEALMGAAQ
jgi:hypothetical protein